MAETNYRDSGAVGALLDEYEKAVGELKALVSTVSSEELRTIVDSETEDLDCRSIQTILAHVVGAGIYYAKAIRNHLGEDLSFDKKVSRDSVLEYMKELDLMFENNVQLFQDYPHLQLEEYEADQKILTRWGQRYDVEQLYEHAIVHILRHRRQIERFLIKLRIA